MQKNKFLLTGGIILGSLLLIGAVFIGITKNKNVPVLTISNLNSCSKNINNTVRDSMTQTIYSFIKNANDYNQKGTAPSYTSTIREGSCKTTQGTASASPQARVKTSTIILDIPDAKQSWNISYDWYTGSTVVDTVVNGASRSCVKSSELIYGDFKCDSIMSLSKYGTDKYDPILQYMPYTGEGFNLVYDPDTKTVTATILIPSQYAGSEEFIQNNKDIVIYWFTHRGLDPSKYTINYTSAPETE